jgi:hypothetical protein
VIRAFSGTNVVHATDEQFLLDLDWKPKLSGTQEVIAWAVPITVCCLVYFFTAPAAISIPYGTCIGVLFGLLLVLVRSIFMEAMYKVHQGLLQDCGAVSQKEQQPYMQWRHSRVAPDRCFTAALTRPQR